MQRTKQFENSECAQKTETDGMKEGRMSEYSVLSSRTRKRRQEIDDPKCTDRHEESTELRKQGRVAE